MLSARISSQPVFPAVLPSSSRTLTDTLSTAAHPDLPPLAANRKWKRIATLHLRYHLKPFYWDEIMPDSLEGKISNFIFTQRMKAANQILLNQKSIRDVAHIWRNVITILLLFATVLLVALLLPASFPVYFGICLIVFVLWSFIQAITTLEPKYEKEIKALCKSWTDEDIHLHLAYISSRMPGSPRPQPTDSIGTLLRNAIKSPFTPLETDWFIFIEENVSILPLHMFGGHREDGSGWTAATMDDSQVRALPRYAPAWDATPAPIYCAAEPDNDAPMLVAATEPVTTRVVPAASCNDVNAMTPVMTQVYPADTLHSVASGDSNTTLNVPPK
ncbi:hypothetical protein BC830DRAFT_1121199 [Chytriomyces sp. MP71]|nr:hypothetical protein BC830DRAFT_1121199 [Chytriomyces sp. MP71]